ncbi:Peptidoglycan/LPS O-acetylase OafA/YrhL, contains acyltransferase and SGNH-hydrolase domains [Streptomyces zhaozhouensis]|uniref:Peptidoglycan/LPS O-acetylase OafA/YrhL, contains acyltransferase and SGNH-hydrolase domains n=1 Tax=Streptomyces zhaozhouensis TaxID=1300267 RepID=A0A286DU76_9ACTN|nr:acyltransferase [Streptomyces zhaozhouensis]SOD62211.1 Peptidoglycan/LPS O-acetylase OafA/YrhL, contains acyltransferase and SGNH-hydrolase domains [Streptomyces zhaozhouensis]
MTASSPTAPPGPEEPAEPRNTHAREGPPAHPPHRARPHIAPLDGLRGVAVVAVVLFHAGHLGGGFLGVDLFFALSGFLITGLLLEEAARHGRIDLPAFWGRRARRLLPALAVVLVATPLLAWAFGSPAQLRFALTDAPWVAGQGVNWHYIGQRLDYWGSSETRLFAPLWSIAVEWQFYLLWPLLVALLARRLGPRAVAALAVTGALLSVALMAHLAHAVDTTRAYEGTDTRAFALLLGSAAATAPARAALGRVPRPAARALGAALAGGLLLSWLLLDGHDAPGLYRGGMFLHSLAAALLIALLAAAPDHGAGRLLGARAPRRLGEVSYGLYLWHWPVYALLPTTLEGPGGWGRTTLALGLSLTAAILSRRWVEDPVRFRAGWARGRRGWLALGLAALAATALWLAVPRPDAGAGTVDVERLTTL